MQRSWICTAWLGGETEAASPLDPCQTRDALDEEGVAGAHGGDSKRETEAGSPAHPLLGLSIGDGCGHTLLTPQSGTLSSRNYPGTYPNHTTCRWRLRTPPGTFLLLTFGDVDLEPSERCASSSLLLTDPQAGISYGKGGTEGG